MRKTIEVIKDKLVVDVEEDGEIIVIHKRNVVTDKTESMVFMNDDFFKIVNALDDINIK